MANAEMITVEVAYARPDEQLILETELTAGSMLLQAVEQSGIIERFPEIDLHTMKVGIFGKRKKRNFFIYLNDVNITFCFS